MRGTSFFILLFLLATACSKPVANFLVEGNNLLPSQVSLINKSSNADSYIWKVNGEIIGNEEHAEFCFFESGLQEIELTAVKGSKTNLYSQKFYTEATSACLVLMRTNYGDLILSLSENTPQHLNNFVELVNQNFYTDVPFHRVIDGFMIQGGDQKLRKTPFKGGLINEVPHEIGTDMYHVRGALSAARMPDNVNPEKKSSGSQFYIVDGTAVDIERLKDIESSQLLNYTDDQIDNYLKNGGAPQLDGEYTVFGHLVEGYDVLDAISKVETDERDKPLKDVIIIEAKMLN